MKLLRIAVGLLFCLSVCLFAVFYVRDRKTDKTYPRITVEGDIIDVSLQADRAELLKGVSAFDEKDGDITGKIIIESVSRFTDPGVSVVTYAVCDNDNHTATATRKIRYANYEAPTFSMSDSMVFGLSERVSVLDRVHATDLIDGDISQKIVITAADYQANVTGIFNMSARVSNSKGDVIYLELPIYVEDISPAAPEIELSEYLVYLAPGESISPESYLLSATDVNGEDLTALVRTDSGLDTSVPGTYQVHFYVSDAAERQQHTVLTVIVEEAEEK